MNLCTYVDVLANTLMKMLFLWQQMKKLAAIQKRRLGQHKQVHESCKNRRQSRGMHRSEPVFHQQSRRPISAINKEINQRFYYAPLCYPYSIVDEIVLCFCTEDSWCCVHCESQRCNKRLLLLGKTCLYNELYFATAGSQTIKHTVKYTKTKHRYIQEKKTMTEDKAILEIKTRKEI